MLLAFLFSVFELIILNTNGNYMEKYLQPVFFGIIFPVNINE